MLKDLTSPMEGIMKIKRNREWHWDKQTYPLICAPKEEKERKAPTQKTKCQGRN